MFTNEQRQEFISQLTRIEKRLRRIRRRINGPPSRLQTLKDLAAAEAAFRRLRTAVLSRCVNTTVGTSALDDDPDRKKQLAELEDVFGQFA